MAFDAKLAERINSALMTINPPGLVSKAMFGGVGYMVQGNMACGILDDRLIVRVGKDAYDEMLALPGTSVFDTTGRPMAGWVMVNADVISEENQLLEWVSRGVDFALTLPAK